MPLIFESPDGGHTVYARVPGEIKRRLYSQSPQKIEQQAEHTRRQLWNSIHQSAKTDPALQQMLDQVINYYTLKNIP